MAIVASSSLRWVVSSAMAMALTLSSLGAVATAGSNSPCPAPEHSCDKPMFTDCCCHGEQPAPTTTTAFAETLSTLFRFQVLLVSWPPEITGGHLVRIFVTAFDPRADVASPPPPDHHLDSVLLI